MGWLKKALKFVVNPLGHYGQAREAVKLVAKKKPELAVSIAPALGVVPLVGGSLQELAQRKAYEAIAAKQVIEQPLVLDQLMPILDRNTSLAGNYEAGLPVQARSLSDLGIYPSGSAPRTARRGSSKTVNSSSRKRKRKSKLKFGSPAWRAKYMKKRRRK
jgi:hypothetical protein